MPLNIETLKYWTQRVLPQVYDDSLSYSELLYKVIEKLNEVIEKSNSYFAKDITEHVTTILEGWVTDGTFADLINDVVFTDISTRIGKLETDLTQTATIDLFVSKTGLDTNNGLTAQTPFATVQKAFDTIKANNHRSKKVTWNIILAAGVYTEKEMVFDTPTNIKITIKAADVIVHPNIPLVVFDGTGGGDYVHGMTIKGFGVGANVYNIKFQNFNGDPAGNSRGGLLFDNGADGYTDNVHAQNCSWFGIYWSRRSQGRQKGGIIQNCRNGVLTDGSKVTVGYGATSLATGTIIKSCTESGVYWCRGTDGHIDYCTLESNGVGVHVDSNSRVDGVGNDFKLNTIGLKCSNGGYFTDNPTTPNNFNIGTANANTTEYEYHAYSGDVTENNDGSSEIRVAYDRTYRTVTGTAPTVLSTPYTIKKGRLKGTGKSLRVMVYGMYTVTAGSTLTVKFGGLTLSLAVPAAAATSTMFTFDVRLHEIQGGYRAFGTLSHSMSAGRSGSVGTGFVNTSDQAISIECTLAGAADTIGIYRTDIFAIG